MFKKIKDAVYRKLLVYESMYYAKLDELNKKTEAKKDRKRRKHANTTSDGGGTRQ